jgi:signal transduction histidine kinase
MRERVELAGGAIRVDSTPSHGTRVDFNLPLSDTAPPAETDAGEQRTLAAASRK